MRFGNEKKEIRTSEKDTYFVCQNAMFC
jgi:hypothetical protein